METKVSAHKTVKHNGQNMEVENRARGLNAIAAKSSNISLRGLGGVGSLGSLFKITKIDVIVTKSLDISVEGLRSASKIA